jgi:hypothetical protein
MAWVLFGSSEGLRACCLRLCPASHGIFGQTKSSGREPPHEVVLEYSGPGKFNIGPLWLSLHREHVKQTAPGS